MKGKVGSESNTILGCRKWKPGIVQISEDLEVPPFEEEPHNPQKERGDSLLDGYFDTSQSSLGEDEISSLSSDKENTVENETPQNLSDDYFVPAKRQSMSPTSPSKRYAASPNSTLNSPIKSGGLKSALLPSKNPSSPKKVGFQDEDRPAPVPMKKPKFKVINGKLVPI